MNKYLLSMIIGALTIGLSPIMTKSVTLSPSNISFYRFFFGTIGLAFYLIATKSKISKETLKKILPATILGGLLFAIDLWFWHRSIIYIGAGIATLLANTQIFYLILIGVLFYKEKPSKIFYIAISITLIGLYLNTVNYIDFKDLHGINNIGIFLGLLTGITYSLVTICIKTSASHFKSTSAYPIFFISLFACLFSGLISQAENTFELISGSNLINMMIYGCIIHVTGWILITKALQKVAVSIAGLILLLQPISATILGILIYAEPSSTIQIIGLVMALIGIYIASISKAKKA